MAGGKELDLPKKSGACSLKEKAAQKTLDNVRQKGHTYVELRKDGKRFVFFCTLCLSPCYSDLILFDHLKGSLHAERLAAAKATLFKPNQWPFNDGVFFFTDLEQDKAPPVSNSEKTNVVGIDWNDDGVDSLAIVNYVENSVPDTSEDVKNCTISRTGDQHQIVIPGVLCRDEISELVVKHIGIGRIAARVCGKDRAASNEICRIWCEWLGNKDSCNEDDIMVPVHDFAIIIFPYNYSLGRHGLLQELRSLPPPSCLFEPGETGIVKTKKRKSFSDPEDVIDSLSNQYDSSGEESQSSDSSLVLCGPNDQSLDSRVFSSKTLRKQLRRQLEVASVRMCNICQQKMLPGKDVATLLNMKTGRLLCSSRNKTGAFHVYHTSCLIHWVLLCELEMHAKQSDEAKTKQRSRRKTETTHNGERKNGDTQKYISSIFCPECQGTGVRIAEEDLEKPTVPLSQMYKFKIKLSDACKAWMKSPEELKNCSTGFTFPPLSDDLCQESVTSLKLLRFYRVDD
ncbi:unnamed protein product [Cuscuta epithymum]|uniref:C2H2-type domain-containing protein n=1 Tax=Cuscuta epithymum TaxID=186058 RepID=A0AAV0E0L0_9ASTE|nr:unnamed protein product [Cuscuta epithymum]